MVSTAAKFNRCCTPILTNSRPSWKVEDAGQDCSATHLERGDELCHLSAFCLVCEMVKMVCKIINLKLDRCVLAYQPGFRGVTRGQRLAHLPRQSSEGSRVSRSRTGGNTPQLQALFGVGPAIETGRLPSYSGVVDAMDDIRGLTPHASRVNGTVSVAAFLRLACAPSVFPRLRPSSASQTTKKCPASWNRLAAGGSGTYPATTC
jgi:hypothetical protein